MDPKYRALFDLYKAHYGLFMRVVLTLQVSQLDMTFIESVVEDKTADVDDRFAARVIWGRYGFPKDMTLTPEAQEIVKSFQQ